MPAVKSLLHRARTALAHQASMPAFVAPFIARLARVRPGQIVMGMVAEHATGAAAIATIAPGGHERARLAPPARAARRPDGRPVAGRDHGRRAPAAPGDPARAREAPARRLHAQDLEYSHCTPMPPSLDAPAPRRAGAPGEYGP